MPALSSTDWITLALAVITAFYAWATFRILRANEGVVAAMREQIDAQLRPYIEVSVAPRIGSNLLCLFIKNTGKSPAISLRLELDKDFHFQGERRDDKNLRKLPAFSQEIDSLPPNSQLNFLLGTGSALSGSQSDPKISPLVFSVSARYQFAKRSYSEQTTIDLRPFFHSIVPIDPVVEELEHLRQAVDKLGTKIEQSLARLSDETKSG
jgi:hypothetical protein